MILTDPYFLDNELLLKPFKNQVKVHYCPINPTVTFKELNKIVNSLQPRHIISPYSTLAAEQQLPEESKANPTGSDGGPALTHNDPNLEQPGERLNVTFPNCVVDQINSGQTIQLSEEEFGSLKYRGKCPTSIASLIKMQSAAGGIQLSRVTDL